MYSYELYHPTFKRAVVLKSDPMGWDAERKTIERDPSLFGIFVKYNPELKFVKDGRSLIAELYNAYGIEADIAITIKKKNISTRAWDVEFEGKLEMLTLKIDKNFCTVKVTDIGFYQKFKNRQDVKVNLQSTTDQDGNSMGAISDLTLPLHSKVIRYESLLKTDGTVTSINAISSGTYYLINGYEIEELDELQDRFPYPTQVSTLLPEAVSKYMYQIKEGGSYQFDIKVGLFWIDAGASITTYTFQIDWKLVTGKPGNYTTTTVGSSYSVTVTPSGPINAEQDFTDSVTKTLVAGDEVYFYGEITLTNGGPGDYNYTPVKGATVSEFKVIADTITPSSEALATGLFETWQRVVRSCTGKSNSFKSNWYGRTENGYASDGSGSLRAITNGDQIRGFSTATNPIYASAKELFETCAAIDGVGMGLEKLNTTYQIVVEPLSYFFRNSKAMRLSFVQDIERSVAADLIYNEIEAGYTTWNNRGQQTNNLDEFCTKRVYSLPITQVKKKLSLIAPYLASGYCIEFARRSASKKTTDTERDKDNFIVQLRRSPALVPEKNEIANTVGVIDSNSIYNARLSPTQNLIRNGARIRSGLYKQDGKQITMSFGDGNNNVITTIGGNAINEKFVNIDSLDAPLWIPEYYEFMAAPSRADWEQLASNPYGYVEFSVSNKDYVKGWLISAKPDAESNKVQFKLLASAL